MPRIRLPFGSWAGQAFGPRDRLVRSFGDWEAPCRDVLQAPSGAVAQLEHTPNWRSFGCGAGASKVGRMDAFAYGLVTLLNGFRVAVTAVANPIVLAVVLCAVALLWLALVEIDLLDRQGTKPRIGRH